MAGTNWHDTTEEIIEKDGKEVSKRITRQAKEKPPKASFKEWGETILKIAGLITIVITVFKYFDSVKERQQEEVRQHAADETAQAHWREEQIRQHSADDTANAHWRIDQLRQQQALADAELKQTQEANDRQKENAEHQQEFNKQLANNFDLLSKRNQADIDKEKREFFLTNLLTASAQMEILLEKPINSSEYIQARDLLFIQISPRLGAIGDTTILNHFLDFKELSITREKIYRAANTCRHLDSLNERIHKQLITDSAALLRNTMAAIRQEFPIIRKYIDSSQLVRKETTDVLEPLIGKFTYKPSDSRITAITTEMPFTHFSRDSQFDLDEIDSLIVGAFRTYKHPLDEVRDIIDDPFTNWQHYFLYLEEEIKTKDLSTQKSEFDDLIRKKINFYQDINN